MQFLIKKMHLLFKIKILKSVEPCIKSNKLHKFYFKDESFYVLHLHVPTTETIWLWNGDRLLSRINTIYPQ